MLCSLRGQDEFGEVCPANWKKGSKTIKATPTDSLEYFSAAANGATNGLKRANGETNGAAEKKASA